MSTNLATIYLPYVDEVFTAESKRLLITNNDFSWSGANTVKVYKVTTAPMNDYDRDGTGTNFSRYGAVSGLDATTEEFTLKKDRSFTFAIDKLDKDETANVLVASSALARQVREVVIPEVDAYTYGVMCANAGIKPDAVTLTKDNIYGEIIKANTALDNANVPETSRVIIVTPDVYFLMKQSSDIIMETDIGSDMRLKGVVSNLDGAIVVKVPAVRLPEKFGFMIAHYSATVSPIKLEEFKIHEDPVGISGTLVEGRINYDAFVLDNKKNGIYYQVQA
ncbi:MAG: hypothetical protein EOM28_08280 [Clostridia bacterium]|nr:hypothetical protein [Clostridia bacterium]